MEIERKRVKAVVPMTVVVVLELRLLCRCLALQVKPVKAVVRRRLNGGSNPDSLKVGMPNGG